VRTVTDAMNGSRSSVRRSEPAPDGRFYPFGTGERANGANTLNEGRWRRCSHRAVYPEAVRIRDAAVRTAHTRLFMFSQT